MSYPLNPLDEYRSYSYQNILIVANTTEALRPFTSSDPGLDATSLGAITNTAQGSAIEVPKSTDVGTGNAFLVLDSRRTSSFAIREFTYTANPGIGIPSQTHVFVGELHMTIVDPDGIVFINYLKFLIDEQLKTDLYGMHFLLKTIFVGHKIDGTTTVISTSGIPLMLLTLEFEVTYKEGIYTLKFVPMSQNAALQIPEFTAVKDVKSMTLANGTFGAVIRSFEDRLNESYRDWYKALNLEIKEAGKAESKVVGKTGRLVQVMITIPDSWENFKVEGTENNNVERSFKKELEKRKEVQDKKVEEQKAEIKKQVAEAVKVGKETQEQAEKRLNRKFVSVAPTLNVYEVLAEIVKLCPEALELANKKAVGNNLIKLFKTVSSVTSNSEVVLIHFDIIEFVVPNVTIKKEEFSQSKFFVKQSNGTWIPKNSLEFDYIFTGKNTDIIEFNLKMERAQMLLMNTGKIGTTAHRMVSDQTKKPDNPVTLNKFNLTFIRENDPIVFGKESIENRKNFASIAEKTDVTNQLVYQKSRNEWLQAVSYLHNQSVLRAKVTIRGNPNLMNKFLTELIPKHIIPENVKIETEVAKDTFVKSSILGNPEAWQSQKKDYRKEIDKYYEDTVNKDLRGEVQDDTEINGPKAHAYPMFIKINVFAPNILEFGSASAKLDEKDNREYTQFWYDGYYTVYSILNKFSEGMFTQELDCPSFGIYGPDNSTTTGGATAPEVTTTAAAKEHADSGAGGVMGADGSVTAVSTKTPTAWGNENRGVASTAANSTDRNYGNEGNRVAPKPTVTQLPPSAAQVTENAKAKAASNATEQQLATAEYEKKKERIKNFFTGGDTPPTPPQLPGV